MSEDIDVSKALELCGFVTGDRQESRLMRLLSIILRLQTDPPIPLTFGEIYDQMKKEESETKLTKAWVHRVLKSLVEVRLVRLENPASPRKRYIADVNTVMAGLEKLKSQRINELEFQMSEIDTIRESVLKLDCGLIAQQFVKEITGTQQKISSRIVRGVEELQRVLRYNILDVAGKGDKIRATALWLGPFVEGAMERTIKFIEAAQRGADVKYLISTEVFKLDEMASETSFDMDKVMRLMRNLSELRKGGLKFDIRIYDGPKTYNQVSFNNENMALIISEDPVTATWITRDFNPDLIDNALKSFDKHWKKSKSFLEMKPNDLRAFGVQPGGLISKITNPNDGNQSD